MSRLIDDVDRQARQGRSPLPLILVAFAALFALAALLELWR